MQQIEKDYVLAKRQSTVIFFFFKAHWETSVGALPELVTIDRPSQYEDVVALNYQKQMTGVQVENALAARAKSADSTKQHWIGPDDDPGSKYKIKCPLHGSVLKEAL